MKITVHEARNPLSTCQAVESVYAGYPYAAALTKAYITQAKSRGFRVATRTEAGHPNPDPLGTGVVLITSSGERLRVRVGFAERYIVAEYYFPRIEGAPGDSVRFTVARLQKLGTPSKAAEAVAEEYPLPDSVEDKAWS